MALIPREELQLDCRNAGRNLETYILSKQPPTSLSGEEIDEVFSPLIDSIEERTKQAVQHGIDEEQGRMQDMKDEYARMDLILHRKATLMGKCNLEVWSEDGSSVRSFAANEDAKDLVDGLLRAENNSWDMLVEPIQLSEGADLNEVEDDEFLLYDVDHHHWNQLLPVYTVVLKEPYCELIGYNRDGFLKYLREHPELGCDELKDLIRNLNKYWLLRHTYFLEGMLDFLNLGLVGNGTTVIERRCQMVIRAGIRRGRLCDRPCQRGKNKCHYHVRRDLYRPY
jgi:hypothetical protein